MKIEIINIIDRGTADQERLWLKVSSDTDLVYFIVFDTTYTTQASISNLPRHTYWFRPKIVKAGDQVILYTKAGTPTETKNQDGSTTHFLFWGLEKTIWNAPGDCAVLFEVSTWQTSQYGQ